MKAMNRLIFVLFFVFIFTKKGSLENASNIDVKKHVLEDVQPDLVTKFHDVSNKIQVASDMSDKSTSASDSDSEIDDMEADPVTENEPNYHNNDLVPVENRVPDEDKSTNPERKDTTKFDDEVLIKKYVSKINPLKVTKLNEDDENRIEEGIEDATDTKKLESLDCDYIVKRLTYSKGLNGKYGVATLKYLLTELNNLSLAPKNVYSIAKRIIGALDVLEYVHKNTLTLNDLTLLANCKLKNGKTIITNLIESGLVELTDRFLGSVKVKQIFKMKDKKASNIFHSAVVSLNPDMISLMFSRIGVLSLPEIDQLFHELNEDDFKVVNLAQESKHPLMISTLYTYYSVYHFVYTFNKAITNKINDIGNSSTGNTCFNLLSEIIEDPVDVSHPVNVALQAIHSILSGEFSDKNNHEKILLRSFEILKKHYYSTSTSENLKKGVKLSFQCLYLPEEDNLFLRLVRYNFYNVFKQYQSFIFDSFLKLSDNDGIWDLTDKNKNNVFHLAVLTNSSKMLKELLSLAQVNRTCVSKYLSQKNKASETPKDLCYRTGSHAMIKDMVDIYNLNSFLSVC